VHGSELRQIPGGKGANQAVASARLGGRTAMIGRVGDDGFGEALVDSLRRNAVRTDAVLGTTNCSSGVALIGVEDSGENAITIIGGANARLGEEDVRRHEDLIASTGAVLLQLEVPLPTVGAAVEIAARHGVLTVLDTAPAPAEGLPDALYHVDVISPNQTEAEVLTGVAVKGLNEAEQAANILQARGAKTVVIKMGAQGALLLDASGDTRHVPTQPVKVVDTTAAGDAFTAALTLALVEGRPGFEAVAFGCAAGSLAATRLGAQPAMPTLDEVRAFMG
jgi:ribokinase